MCRVYGFNQYLKLTVTLFPPRKKSKYDIKSVNWHKERLIKAPWLAVHNKAKYKSFFLLYKI